MKKLTALLLAVAMVLAMTACGGSAEPAQTAPATTEATVAQTEAPAEAPTEAPTEEPTEAPTEPRVAPVDFEPADKSKLPKPIPVEEQLLSEDTQTVTLGTLEEYEDLLWELGFKEVRLAGTHQTFSGVEAWCEPVALTYNEKAFAFEFDYWYAPLKGDPKVENGWKMYGTKSRKLDSVCGISEKEYAKAQSLTLNTIVLGEGQSIDDIDPGAIINSGEAQKNETKVASSDYEMEIMSYSSKKGTTSIMIKAIYYPVTGCLYNYFPNLNGEGTAGIGLSAGDYSVAGTSTSFGVMANSMCFHYIPEAE